MLTGRGMTKSTGKIAKNLKKKYERANHKLQINPEMYMVKDFYWSLKFDNMDITPEEAASQCDILPAAIDEWFDDPDIENWFMTPPIKLRSAIKAVTQIAIRKGRELLNCDDLSIQEKAMRYFIDQATGKAREKSSLIDDEEDDDISLEEDMRELERLMKKGGNSGKENKVKEDKGDVGQARGNVRQDSSSATHMDSSLGEDETSS
jgi:hypothetical protein